MLRAGALTRQARALRALETHYRGAITQRPAIHLNEATVASRRRSRYTSRDYKELHR